MGNSLRCCLSCILPCGAFDLIRVVHINGQVDQYSRPISAAEILAANPNHVLSKPCSDSTATVRRIVVVSPDSDLKRGNIYFLVPSSSSPNSSNKKKQKKKKATSVGNCTAGVKDVADDDSFGSPTKRIQRRRRNGRVGAWRQQLESITEDELR